MLRRSSHGLANDVVAPGELDAGIERLVGELSGAGGEAVAATSAFFNERYGDLTEATLQREARSCIDLCDGPESRAALSAFRERRARGT